MSETYIDESGQPQPKKIVHVVEHITGSKRLPTHKVTGGILNVFEANGNKYYILGEEDAFPIERWGLYGAWTAQFLSGMSFQSMYNTVSKIRQMLDKYVEREIQFSEITLQAKASEEELIKTTEMRYDSGLYIATLFILKEGEDINVWTKAQADEKIMDWGKEGFGVGDFLSLAAHYAVAYQNALVGLSESLMAP